jgi:hypothetical protein
MNDHVCSDVVIFPDIFTIGNNYLRLVIFMYIARENHVFENLQFEKWTAWSFMAQNMEWPRQGFSTRFVPEGSALSQNVCMQYISVTVLPCNNFNIIFT